MTDKNRLVELLEEIGFDRVDRARKVPGTLQYDVVINRVYPQGHTVVIHPGTGAARSINFHFDIHGTYLSHGITP